MKVVEFINDCPENPTRVRQLALKFGISERTLLTAFREQYGVTPKQYLIASGLHHARRMLSKGDPEDMTVSEIAARFGFWDFGRFSEKYRSLYGELTSKTLNSSPSMTAGGGRLRFPILGA
jgi:AraC family ethanolamine operon transcriptional activator